MARIVELVRQSYLTTVTVAAGTGTSSAFRLDGYAMGHIHFPATYDSTSLTFTVSTTESGTYQTLEDSAGNAVTLVVEASKSYALPEAIFGSPWAKLVGGTNEGGAGSSIPITLRA